MITLVLSLTLLGVGDSGEQRGRDFPRKSNAPPVTPGLPPTPSPHGVTEDGRIDFFEKKIRPILVERCYECHSANAKKLGANLLLDSQKGMLTGGESGPALVPGKPDQSLILRALSWKDDDLQMPPKEPLPEATVNDFVEWVQLGAPDPRTGDVSKKRDQKEDVARRWSFRPLARPAPPPVERADWPRDPLDRFVLARLEAAKGKPTRDASPSALVRRLFVDLIGMRPLAGEVDAFVTEYARDGRDAIERLVDDLLASPHFGERWGRHWLDVARFGESNGNDGLGRNASFPHAWRYRDWVIAAFNNDLPYDRFITEQLAGDLLPATTAAQRNRQLIATGFLAIGAKPAAAMNQNFAMDIVDDQIDAVSTAIMGLSVACARCHDHKHDPIPTSDYYALAGIFKSTETLYGLAANQGLTAPKTSLHELRSSLAPPKKRPAPVFPEAYDQFVAQLKPKVRERLDVQPKTLKVEKGARFSNKDYGAIEEGRLRIDEQVPADSYSVSFWLRNDLGNRARAITAYVFSHAADGDKRQNGDQLGIGGTHEAGRSGKLFVWNGQDGGQSIRGKAVIPEKSWNHIVLARSDEQVRVWLNGVLEIEGKLKVMAPMPRKVFIGARNDNFAPLKGYLADIALFDRALTAEEALRMHATSGQPKGVEHVGDEPSRLAMGVRDRDKVEDCKVNIGGNSKKLGKAVPRGFLTACTTIEPPPPVDTDSSGRLELARWLMRGDHPQTARVMVNRIWLWLFGQSIVETVDDFGVYGARPTHPQLLDHLAARFVAGGWSMKKLIREIVLSRTYGLSAQRGGGDDDQDNVLLARHLRRRLDAESLRDSILRASGSLDASPGRGSVIDDKDILINKPPGAAKRLHEPSDHRSVYLCMLRDSPPPELAAFDFPEGREVRGQREVSTQPTHALFLLNNPWVVKQSRLLASRLLAGAHADDSADDSSEERAALVCASFRRVLARDPVEGESERALFHVRSIESDLSTESDERRRVHAWASLIQALMASNEFRYID